MPADPAPLWKRKRGVPLKFRTPALLWSAAEEYFDWCADHPLREEKLFAYEGSVTRDHISKMRAMTERGMCFYIGLDTSTWYDYCKRDEFRFVCEQIKAVIWEQKFTAAAADLMNANIIGKELGLIERTTVEGPGGGPVQIDVGALSDGAMEELLAARRKAQSGQA